MKTDFPDYISSMSENLPDTISEETIIRRCQEGDHQAFNLLVQRYQKLVYNFIYRLAPNWRDVDDLAQEVFIRVYKSISMLKEAKQFKSWLHRIVINLYYDEIRKRRRVKEVDLEDNPKIEAEALYATSSGNNPIRSLEEKELERVLQKAMNHLSPDYKVAIMLREIQGLSYEEIAQTLKCSVGTVKSRIFRARELLKEELREYLQ
jgi:RNA polymerase sigma-70 factor (ECF subfamily)